MKVKDLTGRMFGKLEVISLASLGPTKWLCRCDCGKEKTVSANCLRAGDTISCGCHKKGKELKLEGKRFGRLTVLSLFSISPRKWMCKCDCGNETVVVGSNLCNGNTMSCGCHQKEIVSQACLHDLTGKFFGKLTVLSYVGCQHWKCQCECGNITTVRGQDLTIGNTLSCGCYHREVVRKARLIDLTGKRFGKLLVLSEGDNRKGQIYWLCKCDCGKEKLIAGNSLSHRKSKSCGCGKGRFIHGMSGKPGYLKYIFHINPAKKLKHYVASSIRKTLGRRGLKKNKSVTFKYLPYTPSDLKKHLENLWEPWMNWKNYGGRANDPRKTWHIDHIIPHCNFKYTTLEDPLFSECWALSNLRPLEKIENIKKGGR